MTPRPPRSTRTNTLFPYTTLCRAEGIDQAALDAGLRDHAFALPRVFDAGRVAPACDHRLERSAGVAPGEVLAPADVEAAVRRLQGGYVQAARSEEHTSELQSLMRISYAVFCLKKKIVI